MFADAGDAHRRACKASDDDSEDREPVSRARRAWSWALLLTWVKGQSLTQESNTPLTCRKSIKKGRPKWSNRHLGIPLDRDTAFAGVHCNRFLGLFRRGKARAFRFA